MGKAAMCIKLLQILNTGRIFKVSELASLLETNPRNIVEYKKELEECGYFIDTIPGRYGGYKIDKRQTIPTIHLDESEKEALMEAYRFLIAKSSFMNKHSYEHAMAKITSSTDVSLSELGNLLLVEKEPSIYEDKLIENTYNSLQAAIKECYCCKIEYLSNNNKIQTKIIKPYELYVYNDDWFVVAECEGMEGFLQYKLLRIKKLIVINKHFCRDSYFKRSDYVDERGFKKNNEWYDIKLEVSGYYLLKLKERNVGKNQSIEMIDSNTAIFKATMQYRFNIINFVMGLGSFCKVLEPQWLVNQVMKITTEMQNLYLKGEDKGI